MLRHCKEILRKEKEQFERNFTVSFRFFLHSYDSGNLLPITAVDGNDYLVELAVTVRRNLPEARRPAVCRLVRWLALEPEEEEEE